ncbi:MAG: hypothetical protein Q8934_06780 [Bacillota bacterium]|nr:hypothetical protein [Bacillota bacterium]
MEKKKFTTWGVSFTSLALVAGMISYLGISNKETASQVNKATQSQAITQNSTDKIQGGNNQNSSFTYELPNQSSDNNGSQSSFNQSTQNDQSSSNQHGNFDTTTGGT